MMEPVRIELDLTNALALLALHRNVEVAARALLRHTPLAAWGDPAQGPEIRRLEQALARLDAENGK